MIAMINAAKSFQCSLIILFFFLLQTHQSQAQLTATWGLTSTTLKTCLVEGVQSTSITAGDMVAGSTFDPLGGHNIDGYKCAIPTSPWPNVATDGYNIDFPISPVGANDLTVSGLTFTARTSGGSGSNLLSLAYQVDGAGSWITIGTVQTANSGGTTSINFGSLSTLFPGGHTYMIRLYAYASGASTTSSRKLYIKNVVFSGTTVSSPLPVVISKFTVQCNASKQGVIRWTSQTEAGVLKYEIESSENGQSFQSIKTIAPQNNQNGTFTYTFTDENSKSNQVFYRIKTTHEGGETEYSNIQKSSCAEEYVSAAIFPNPIVNKLLTIQFKNYSPGNYQLIITNKNGQLIQRSNVNLLGGIEKTTLKLNTSIAPGNYTLKISGNQKAAYLPFQLF